MNTSDHWWVNLSDPAPLLEVGDHWWRPIPRASQSTIEILSATELPILPAIRYPADQWRTVVRSPGPWGHVDGPEVVGCLAHEAPAPLIYPHEWSADQWFAVAEHGLSLSLTLFAHGLRLKRLSPWDFHFYGGRVRFHNWFQVEEAPVEEAAVVSFPSFLKGFLYPLLAGRELGLEPRLWATSFPLGIPIPRLYRAAGWSKRFRHPFLSLVVLPYWMDRFTRRARRPPRTKPDRARKAVESLHHQSLGWLRRLAPRTPVSFSVDKKHVQGREKALAEWLPRCKPARSGDLYCRTGHLSRILASHGIAVVAMDPDEDRVRRASPLSGPVQYMVMDVASPSAAFTFGTQARSFLDRFRQSWDLVLACDRFLHHWRETRQLPVPAAFGMLHQLTREWAIVEGVPVGEGQDRMGLDSLREHAAPWFTIEATHSLGLESQLWLLKSRPQPKR